MVEIKKKRDENFLPAWIKMIYNNSKAQTFSLKKKSQENKRIKKNPKKWQKEYSSKK